MIWWDWGLRRKTALLGGMIFFPLAGVVWVFGLHTDLGTILGGVSFLFIPELMAWMLFVGLRTGFMPQRGAKVIRATQPVEFWVTAVAYAVIFVMFIGFLITVALD